MAHPQVSSTVRHIQLSSSCTLQNERALAQMPQGLDLFFGNLNCVVNNNETSGYIINIVNNVTVRIITK